MTTSIEAEKKFDTFVQKFSTFVLGETMTRINVVLDVVHPYLPGSIPGP